MEILLSILFIIYSINNTIHYYKKSNKFGTFVHIFATLLGITVLILLII